MNLRLIILVFVFFPLGANADPIPNWFAEVGYELLVDTADVRLPTSIAFIPSPGRNKEDPLYLVAELRGEIRVVTRDKKLHLFANNPSIYKPNAELPDVHAEIGQIGLCFDAKGDRLYSTMAGLHGKSKRINKIIRWENGSPRKWLTGKKAEELFTPFLSDHTTTAHQIQNCFVDSQEKLWVGVGDGKTADNSHRLTSSLGKILRMNLDFTPVADNPFYESSFESVKNFIYAYGLRNPTGIAEGRNQAMYVADNGNSIDRLLKLERGKEYPWDNTDTSFTYDNILNWPKTIGPASMIYVKDNSLFPELNDHLIVTGSFDVTLYAIPMTPGGVVAGNPKKLFYATSNPDKALIMTGVAMGEDGLYVSVMRTTPIQSVNGETDLSRSAIMKLVPAKDVADGKIEKSGAQLVEEANCRGCHVLDGWGGSAGPSLDNLADTLPPRIDGEPYREKLKEILASNQTVATQYTSAIEEMIARDGLMGDRMRNWVEIKLQYPSFDNPDASMPQLNIGDAKRRLIAEEVVKIAELRQTAKKQVIVTFSDRIKWYSQEHKLEAKGKGFLIGLIFGIGGVYCFRWARRRFRRAKP